MANKASHPNKQTTLINMSWNICFLRVTGQLGLAQTAAWKHLLHNIYTTMIFVLHVVILTVNIAGIVRDWGDFDAVINNCIITAGILSSFVKFVCMIYKRQDVVLLLHMLQEFETYEWPQPVCPERTAIVNKTSCQVRIMNIALIVFILLIFLSWTLSPIITTTFSGPDPSGRRILPFISAFFFDYQTSPNYELIYCFEVVSLFVFCVCVISFDTVCTAFFMQAAGQFRVMLASLRKLQEVAHETPDYSVTYNDLEEKKAVRAASSLPGGSMYYQQDDLRHHVHQYLNNCIRHHINVIRFARKLDEVFNPIMLAQIIYSMCEIAISGLQATESFADFGNLIKFAIYATSLSFEVYFFCGHADDVLHLSQEVATAAYSCEWYNMDPQVNIMLRIIIMRAQRAVQLTAFRFKVLSIDLYGSLLNAAYTYFALLKEVKKGNDT